MRRWALSIVFVAVLLPGTTSRQAKPETLHDAVRAGDAQTIRELRLGYANPNVREAGGITPLMLAASSRPAMVAPLLQHLGVVPMASLDATLVDDRGQNALMHAVRSGHFATAKTLLELNREGVYTTDRRGHNAFDYAFAKKRFTAADAGRIAFLEQAMWVRPLTLNPPPPALGETASALCEKRITLWDLRARLAADIASGNTNVPVEENRQLVLCAARAGMLLRWSGAASALKFRFEVVDDRGYTPEMIAVIEGGRPFDADGDSLILDAVERNLPDATLALLARRAPRPAGAPLGKAMLLATSNGKCEVVEKLLGAGVSPDVNVWPHETALAEAARRGWGGCVRLLLAAGASLHPGTNPDETYLLEIASPGVRPMIEEALRAARPRDKDLQAEETAVAIEAFAALEQARRAFKEWKLAGLPRYGIRQAAAPAAVRDALAARGYAGAGPEDSVITSMVIKGFLWTTPSSVRVPIRTVRVEYRPRYRNGFFGAGSEVTLEKRAGRWIAGPVRRSWVE